MKKQKSQKHHVVWILCAGFAVMSGLVGCGGSSEEEATAPAASANTVPGGSGAGMAPADTRGN